MNARTLRQIVGVPPSLQAGATLAAGKTAVIFIDYQNEYRNGPLALPDEPAASNAARQLRAWADRAGITVIHVLHRAPATAPIFAPDSAGAAPIAGLAPGEGEAVIHKHLPSAFTGTGLLDELQRRGVETLIIAGYMTHNCVDSTARDAFHRGYRVGVVADASATRDLPGPDGQTIPAATVHAAVLAGLGDRIAEIIDVATLAAMDVV
ncbi:MAG: cysteine hydrolase [Gammaproteobacteria bacterium]|nr:cysteine hydrolase [Gammaproteobacteria bacterium]MBU2435784.1 cysteine hydrolase [Gammaproteobacteria bacterium]MBU2449435.1 cysteine hydrolase [Gammaproteobacteria bacterium]